MIESTHSTVHQGGGKQSLQRQFFRDSSLTENCKLERINYLLKPKMDKQNSIEEEDVMTDADFERAMEQLREQGDEDVNELLSEIWGKSGFDYNLAIFSGNERE